MIYSIAFLLDSVPFGRGEIDGTKSLGGSESAALGVAHGLAARGHQVHIFAKHLADEGIGPDPWGVIWHHVDAFEAMNTYTEWDVFCVVRMFPFYHQHRVNARLRLLWNQDVWAPDQLMALIGTTWAVDAMVYVSDFHRQWFETQHPMLKGLGWTTKNGYDPTLVPVGAVKDPNRIIHISRPERGLTPLLAMWPALKAQVPHATLQVCRYNSMYDAGGWAKVCAAYDAEVRRVNEKVGGVTFIGELGKAELYQRIAESAVMWYPGVVSFAETSCIAALEAQACGTPFVGSYKGALPETVPSGTLIKGDAMSPEYQEQSIAAVLGLLQGCATTSFAYRATQRAGREHVKAYRYDVLASEWEQRITDWFTERYEHNKIRVMRQLLYEDDHVAAKVVAEDLVADGFEGALETFNEANQAALFCDYVIAGKDQTAEHYAERANPDPINEAEHSQRFHLVAKMLEGKTNVLDIACGNGSFALWLIKNNPEIRVTGLDYAQGNIDAARAAAERYGVADRCTFECVTVYDFDTQTMTEAWDRFAGWTFNGERQAFDAAFVGEFIEHVAGYRALIDGVEAVLQPGATVVYSCPHGPMVDLIPKDVPIRRGHVHRFTAEDLQAVFGQKVGYRTQYLHWGGSQRQHAVGNWILQYEYQPGHPTGERPLAERIRKTRPFHKLTFGLITFNAEADLCGCLDTIWPLADEIIIGDTGSTDDTVAIAKKFGDKVRVLSLPDVRDHPEGFAGARNAVLTAATGDWFAWIDADERLIGGSCLHKYLESGPFIGLAIAQNHLMLDAPLSFDTPVRVFRRDQGIQFYGCIHEQPQQGDCNTDVFPALHVPDVQLAHFGYLTESVRRQKSLRRNLPLLERDRVVFPTRELGMVFVIRDYANLADHAKEQHNGQILQDSARWYRSAILLFEQHFGDPRHKFHKVARPYYERALRGLGVGIEVQAALSAKPGTPSTSDATIDRFWVRDVKDIAPMIAWKTEALTAGMTPKPMHVDPFEPVDESVPSETVTA